jgi:hypothetical protein
MPDQLKGGNFIFQFDGQEKHLKMTLVSLL